MSISLPTPQHASRCRHSLQITRHTLSLPTYPHRSERILYAQIGGAQGLVGALLTALKQLLPDLETPVPRLRAKDLPFLFALSAVVFGVVFDALDEVPFAVLGVVVAWGYLRFFQEQRDGSLGDRSEGFSFLSFFPRMLQPLVCL